MGEVQFLIITALLFTIGFNNFIYNVEVLLVCILANACNRC